MKLRLPALFVCLAACQSAIPNTYVLFAGTAREDRDMERVITIRLPLRRQPAGATVFCLNDRVRIWATRYSDTEVKIRRTDQRDSVVEIPEENLPVGLATSWPEGRGATRCGLDPMSPLGSHAYLEWGTIRVFLERIAPDQLRYGVGSEQLELAFPLSEEDREKLRGRGLPAEVVNLLF